MRGNKPAVLEDIVAAKAGIGDTLDLGLVMRTRDRWIKGLTHYIEPVQILNPERPHGLDELAALADSGAGIIVASTHFAWMDPIVSMATTGEEKLFMRMTAGSNAFSIPLPGLRGFLHKRGVIEAPRLGSGYSKARRAAYKQVLVERLSEGLLEFSDGLSRSVPVWVSLEDGRNKKNQLHANPSILNFVLELVQELIAQGGAPFLVVHDLLLSTTPDLYSIAERGSSKSRRRMSRYKRWKKSFQYAWNDYKFYRRGYLTNMWGCRADVHSWFSEPINLAKELARFDAGTPEAMKSAKAWLERTVNEQMFKGAVVFDTGLAAAVIGAYSSSTTEPCAPEQGTSITIPLREATLLANEWLGHIDAKHKSISKGITENQLGLLLLRDSGQGSCFSNKQVHINGVSGVQVLRGNRFVQVYRYNTQ